MHSSSFVSILFYSRHSSSPSQSPQNCAHLWCQAVHWRYIWTSGGAEVTGGRMEMSGVAGKPPRQFVWIWRSYWSWWKEECPSWIWTNWNERWDRNNTAHRLPLVIHLRRWWDDHSVCSNQAVRHPWRSWRLQRSVKRVGEGGWGGSWGKTNHTPMNKELKQRRRRRLRKRHLKSELSLLQTLSR